MNYPYAELNHGMKQKDSIQGWYVPSTSNVLGTCAVGLFGWFRTGGMITQSVMSPSKQHGKGCKKKNEIRFIIKRIGRVIAL